MSRNVGLVFFLSIVKGVPIVSLLAAIPALAAGKQSLQSQEQAARKACLNGDYAKGTSILSDLFIQTGGNSVFIFNQARCFESNRRYEDAAARFEEFIRTAEASTAGLTPDDKTAAEMHIADCKQHIEQESHKTLSPEAQASSLSAPAIAPIASGSQSQPTTSALEVTRPAPTPTSLNRGTSGHGTRVGGIVTAAAGLAAVGAGVGFNLAERSLHNQMSRDAGKNTTDNENRRGTYQTISIIGYSVGAAALVTGTVLYVLGVREDGAADDRVSLAAEFAARNVSLGLKGKF
jgi:hypothetical protein